MEFPKLKRLNVTGLHCVEKLDYNPNDFSGLDPQMQRYLGMTVSIVPSGIFSEPETAEQRLIHRDSIMNMDYRTLNDTITQAMALGYEKRPSRQPYKHTSGVFFNITWLFKKVCLYLSKIVIYVKFRTVCNFKPASKQYLPHSTV
jgi:hypothetical protein